LKGGASGRDGRLFFSEVLREERAELGETSIEKNME